MDRMCYKDIEDLDSSDYTITLENDTEVIRYSDNTSKFMWGGPCSPQCYDENGEEC